MNDVTPLGGPQDRETEETLRSALRAEAERVTPGDRFHDIHTAAAATTRRRPMGPVLLGVAAAAAVIALVAVVVPGLIRGDNAPTAGAPVDVSSSPALPPPTLMRGSGKPTAPAPEPSIRSGEATPGAPASGIAGVPVYWIGPGEVLYREFRTVPEAGDRVTSALSAMTTIEPLDPDYTSAWPLGTRFAVTRDGDDLTVDVTGLGRSEMSEERARAAVQQLVWTATAAAQLPGEVTVLIDGAPGLAFGRVEIGEATPRDPDARSQVWITDPYEGQPHTAGEVSVTGESTAFEGTLEWTVTRPDGSVAAEGFTTGGANGEYGPFSFATDLPAGTYLITVTATDPSDGESGRAPAEDTKTIVVE